MVAPASVISLWVGSYGRRNRPFCGPAKGAARAWGLFGCASTMTGRFEPPSGLKVVRCFTAAGMAPVWSP